MTSYYKTTDGQPKEEMTDAEALELIASLGDRVAPSYTSDDGDFEIYEVYGTDETAADYPDGDPYADSIWVPCDAAADWEAKRASAAAATLGRKGGRSTSSAKQTASRANGRRGGRNAAAARAADAYALRPCDYRHTDGDQTPGEFARRLAENAGMNLTPALRREILKIIAAE